jgi:hypothetical protein
MMLFKYIFIYPLFFTLIVRNVLTFDGESVAMIYHSMSLSIGYEAA